MKRRHTPLKQENKAVPALMDMRMDFLMGGLEWDEEEGKVLRALMIQIDNLHPELKEYVLDSFKEKEDGQT